MEETPGDISSELESFREQWRAEVRAKTSVPRPQTGTAASSSASSSRPQQAAVPPAKFASLNDPAPPDNDEDYVQARSLDHPQERPTSSRGHTETKPGPGSIEEPVSALDHYEQAVEKEAQGSLGESLRLYRKAFRMDSNVDQKYKNKHFPTRPPQASASPLVAGVVPPAASPSPAPAGQPQTFKELMASFASLSIEPAPPAAEGMPESPCPIADLPQEILVHILRDVAVSDVGDFVRLAQVCKRLAYLVATEDQIWRRVCLGTEVGFGAMHHQWQNGVSWEPLDEAGQSLTDGDFLSAETCARQQGAESLATTKALLPMAYSGSWKTMFRTRPRVRFNGCYISTVNYTRSGQASAHQTMWNSPVHIVTYFRYLRLFRDGTAISLCTTDEPADVVHHLTRELVNLHRGGVMAHLPSIVMQSAFRGRWRLSSAADNPSAPLAEAEGDLFVETEGVGKYLYRLELALQSAGKAARNNKLLWRGFYSYNKLTDDWGEFGLKHDKPFFFSRVKSYGMGE